MREGAPARSRRRQPARQFERRSSDVVCTTPSRSPPRAGLEVERLRDEMVCTAPTSAHFSRSKLREPIAASTSAQPPVRAGFTRCRRGFRVARLASPDAVLLLETQRDPGEVDEPSRISRDHRPAPRDGSGCDQEIVCSSRASRASSVRQQPGVGPGDLEIVRLDRDGREDVIDEAGPSLLPLAVREFDPDEEFRCRDRGDGHVVVVRDDRIEGGRRALGRDEDRRVDDQSFQRRSSIASDARTSRSSDAQRRSGGVERKISFTRLPFAARAGSMRATARPRRTTRKLSPRRSTESSSSEKRLAASVALSVCM